MSCGLEKDRLSGYYDGELATGERAEIERHIASCSECLRELGELKAAGTDLKSLARVPAPPSVRAEILRQTAVRAPRFQRWFQAGVAAAAVALFTVSLVIIARQGEREDTVATLNPPARTQSSAPERTRADEVKDLAGDQAALKQDRARAAKVPASRDDKVETLKEEKELDAAASDMRQPDAAPPPKAEPKPAERPSNDPAPGAVPGENREELRKKAEPFGFAEGAEREVRRGGATGPAAPTVLSIAAADLPSTREETDALFKKLGVKAVVGATELGNTSHVKDHYTTVELTDAEYEALQKHLAKAKAKVASTTLAAEKANLARQLRARSEYAFGASSDGGRKSGAKGASPPAPAAPETAGADRGKSDEKKPSDGATGQGGGGAAGGRSPEGGKESKDAQDAKKAQEPAADAPKGDADKQAEAKKPQAPDHGEGADAEDAKRAEEEQQKEKLLDKAPRRRFIIHWIEPAPPAATGSDK